MKSLREGISRIVCFVFLVLLALPGWVHGAGFQLFNELSARSMGNGSAMTARLNVAESAWFNPAALPFMSHNELVAGVAAIVPSMELDMPGGNDPDMQDKVYPVPYFYSAYKLNERVGLGLSFNYPYGLETEWDTDWPGRFYAVKTELRTAFLTPSASVKLCDHFAVGAGLQIVRGDAELQRSIYVPPVRSEIWTEIEGGDNAGGYMLSAMLLPFKDWSIGVIYRSEVVLELEGKAKYWDVPGPVAPAFSTSRVDLKLRLPATVAVGVTTTMIPNLTLSLDYLWTRWSSYESLDFIYEKAPGKGIPGTVSVPKQWHDDYAVRFGAEYELNSSWLLRGSYVYDRSPIDDKYRDPSLPTNDRHLFSLGLGYNLGNFSCDLAYTYLHMEDSKTSLVTPTLSGTYEGDAHIANLDLRWTF